MTSIKTRVIKRALSKKGFVEESSKHIKYILCDEEGKTSRIFTIFSHGSKEYSDDLLSAMAKQLKLEKSEFIRFVECTLSHEKYLELLREKKVVF